MTLQQTVRSDQELISADSTPATRVGSPSTSTPRLGRGSLVRGPLSLEDGYDGEQPSSLHPGNQLGRAATGSRATVGRVIDAAADRRPRNQLLAGLSATEWKRVRPHFELVNMEQRELIFDPEVPIAFAFFPDTAIVSLVSHMRDGSSVEVGTAGREGMAGLSLFLAGDTSSVQAFAQVPGDGWRIPSAVFMELSRVPGVFQDLLLRYTQAFLTQVAQTAACNGSHLVEQRCARWLLMTHDRVQGDDFPLTHEFLAFMLGVRRAGVTVAMRGLQDQGFLRYSRGKVKIVDRTGLESTSCECYAVVRGHFQRLLPQAEA